MMHSIENGFSYSAFPNDNQRYECNKKKSPLVNILYQSNSGYVGPDTAKIKVIFPTCNLQTDLFNMGNRFH